MIRIVCTLVLAGALLGPAAGTGRPGPRAASLPVSAAGGSVRYAVPVTGALRVLRRFDAPARYAAGHRGLDLETSVDRLVRAAGDGRVAFAGAVAGRGVVVLVHPDGVSTEYEPVRPVVARARAVHRGDVIGVLTGRHRGCARARCLHWGARRAGGYLDPLTLLRPLGPIRLLP